MFASRGAALYAAARKMRERGYVSSSEQVGILNTAAWIKYRIPFRWTCRYCNRVTDRRDELRLESRAVDSTGIRRSVAGNPSGRAIATSLLVALVNASSLVLRVPLFWHWSACMTPLCVIQSLGARCGLIDLGGQVLVAGGQVLNR